MSPCHGNNQDHCCYVMGEPCRYLEQDTVPGRKWVCGLMRELGSWSLVHAHAGYQEHVQSAWDKVGIESCGAWGPGTNQCCYSQTPVSIN